MLARFVVNSHIHHHPTNTNREDDTETFKIPNTTSAEPLPQVTPCSPYYVLMSFQVQYMCLQPFFVLFAYLR